MDAVRKKLAVVFFLVCWSSQVEPQGQGVYLQLLNGTKVSNHSFVARGELSRPTDNPLSCVMLDNTTCWSTAESGNWYFPNGTEVPPNSTGWLFYTTRGPGVVRLHRHTGGVSGIYHCVIPDQSGVNQTLYVGLYAITDQTSGEIFLQQNIEFQLLPLGPITEPPKFTLTCVTTGGPPTNVVWARNNTEIDYESDHNFRFSRTVTNFVNSTYNNTLTVTGRYPGQYNMKASNRNTVIYIVSQSVTSDLLVKAAAPPTHLTAVQGSDPTTVNVSWTAPVSGDSVTGYRIYYQTEGDQGSVDVGASTAQHVLTGLCGGRNYSIYLVALSAHLPSPVVGPAVVKLGDLTPSSLCVLSDATTSTAATTSNVATNSTGVTTSKVVPNDCNGTTTLHGTTTFHSTTTLHSTLSHAPRLTLTPGTTPDNTVAVTNTVPLISTVPVTIIVPVITTVAVTSPAATISTSVTVAVTTGVETSAIVTTSTDVAIALHSLLISTPTSYTTPDSTGVLTRGMIACAIAAALLGLLVFGMCVYIIYLRNQNSGAKSGGPLRSKEGIPMQACVAYRTHNTPQPERRNSSVDESPADEMMEGKHEVGKDDSDAYEYDYVETFTQS